MNFSRCFTAFAAAVLVAGCLGVASDHKPNDVLQKKQGDFHLIAIEYETSGFIRRFCIDHSSDFDTALLALYG